MWYLKLKITVKDLHQDLHHVKVLANFRVTTVTPSCRSYDILLILRKGVIERDSTDRPIVFILNDKHRNWWRTGSILVSIWVIMMEAYCLVTVLYSSVDIASYPLVCLNYNPCAMAIKILRFLLSSRSIDAKCRNSWKVIWRVHCHTWSSSLRLEL